MRRARCLFSSHCDVLDGRATLRQSFSSLAASRPQRLVIFCLWAPRARIVAKTKCMMNCRRGFVLITAFEFIIRRLAIHLRFIISRKPVDLQWVEPHQQLLRGGDGVSVESRRNYYSAPLNTWVLPFKLLYTLGVKWNRVASKSRRKQFFSPLIFCNAIYLVALTSK